MDEDSAIRRAPRVRRDLIRRLYEDEARGLLDDQLLDEVGIGLYARCESIMKARRPRTADVSTAVRAAR